MTDCPQDLLAQAAAIAGGSQEEGLAKVDALLNDYGLDGRLHFLRGSLLAGLQRYDEARAAMTAAVEFAPQFPLARFQLGLLRLTSGQAAEALAVWAPLDGLPVEHPLRLFTEGLRHMVADDYEAAIALLEQGIARNADNPPLNHDMQMLVRAMLNGKASGSEPDQDVTSSAEILLKQFSKKPTKH